MAIKTEMIDELIKNCKTSEDIFGEGGLVKQFVKSVLERVLQAELTTHLGYEKHEPKGKNSGNSRNGASGKTINGEFGEVRLDIPRDRIGPSVKVRAMSRHLCNIYTARLSATPPFLQEPQTLSASLFQFLAVGAGLMEIIHRG